MPAGKIRAADIADLAGADEVVERVQRFLNWGERIEAVELEEVDIVRSEALEGALDCGDQVEARRADVVRAGAQAKGGLGRDKHLVAPALDRGAQHLLGKALGIDVGAV